MSWVSGFFGGLTRVRSAIIDFVVVGSLAAFLAIAVLDIRESKVIIEEIGLPEKMQKLGYSEKIASIRLWDAMVRLNDETLEQTDFDRKTPFLSESEQLDISEPQTGLSLSALVAAVRQAVGLERRRVAGEFVCGEAACELRLRVFNGERVARISNGPLRQLNDAALDQYFDKAALRVLQELDPMLVAEYLNGRDDAKAESLAETIYFTGNGDSGRAAALLVQINGTQRDDAAIQRWVEISQAETGGASAGYWKAIALALKVPAMRSGNHRLDEANRALEEADKAFEATLTGPSRSNRLGYLYWSAIRRELGDGVDALAKLKAVEPWSTNDASYLAQRGFLEAMTGDIKKSENTFIRATSIRQSDYIYEYWGWALESTDLKRAREMYAKAAALNPRNPMAFHDWGRTLAAEGSHGEAVGKFWRATRRDPENAFAYFDWAKSLAALGKNDEAARRYARAFKINPHLPDYFPDAVELYKQSITSLVEGVGPTDCAKFQALAEEFAASVPLGDGTGPGSQVGSATSACPSP